MKRLLLFFLIPALELYLLVKMGSLVGALSVVLWVFASAGLGVWVLREQGQSAMNRVRLDLSGGTLPTEALLHGVLLFFSGVLLILPGLITDAVGLLLLIPFVRTLSIARLLRYLTEQQTRRPAPGGGAPGQFFFFSSTTGGRAGGFERPETPRQATIIDCTPIEVAAGAVASGDAYDRGTSFGPEVVRDAQVFDCEARPVDLSGMPSADSENDLSGHNGGAGKK